MNNQKFEILDLILSKLNMETSSSLYDVQKAVNDKIWHSQPNPEKFVPVSVIDSKQVEGETELALEYLEKEGLIKSIGGETLYLAYEGHIKILNGGFVNEAKRLKRNGRLNNFFWVATPVVAFLSFLISIYLLFRSGM